MNCTLNYHTRKLYSNHGMLKKYWNILSKILIMAIFCLAVWLVYNKLRAYSLESIRQSIAQIPFQNLIACAVLTIINYIVLVAYDWLAIKATGKSLHLCKVAMVSFVGFAVSYNFGALLAGTPVRYRLYSAWKFTTFEIVRLILMIAVAFWIGVMGLAGMIFFFVPFDIPPGLNIPGWLVRPLGGALLLLCCVYLALCKFADGRTITLFSKKIGLPSFKLAVLQTIVACIDFVIAAACLYVLLPQESGVPFWEFVPAYMLAQVSVVLTHVPGGLGVLEVILMNLIALPANIVFASILIFRLIYYIIPLLLAAVIMVVNEFVLQASVLKKAHDASLAGKKPD